MGNTSSSITQPLSSVENNPAPKIGVVSICRECAGTFVLQVDKDRYIRWNHGEGRIQNMLPELSKAERELLLSGICGACFEALFAEQEDGE